MKQLECCGKGFEGFGMAGWSAGFNWRKSNDAEKIKDQENKDI